MERQTLFFRKYPGKRPNNPYVLICHGLFGNSLNFAGISEALSANYTVVSVDLRNHGNSFHADKMSYPIMADDIENLIDGFGENPFAFIGHSMGGKVVMTCLNMKKKFIEKTVPVVLDIYPTQSGEKGIRAIVDAMRGINLELMDNRTEIREALESKLDNTSVVKFLMTNIISAASGKLRWRINLEPLHRHLNLLTGFPEAHKEHVVDNPLHIIYGTESAYDFSENADETLRIFPNTTFYPIESAGHWLHFDQKQTVIDTITKILANSKH